MLTGNSYGGFIALDYAVLHSDKLLALILSDTWAYGVPGAQTALANIVTSKRLHDVDVARQVRVWSGTLRDDADYIAAIQDIWPIYDPPSKHAVKGRDEEGGSGKGKSENKGEEQEPKTLDGVGKLAVFHYATQNAAFGVNVPHFDVRHKLGDIKVRNWIGVIQLSPLLKSVL